MIRRSRKSREIPALNTSSLPDLIFTVLFFFMIVTHMRSVAVKVRYQVPQGKELSRQAKKSSTIHIYIGKPLDKQRSENAQTTIVQVNDRIVAIDELSKYIANARASFSPEKTIDTSCLLPSL